MKVNLTIDGHKVQADAGHTILQVAEEAGIHIPILCHHPALPPGESKERKMTQTRSRVWVEVFAVVVTLALGGMLLYALLPFITAAYQQVVPPPQPMDVGQTLLTLFIAATAIGAPLTAGIVLALVFKFASKRVAASSSVAPEIPGPKAKPRAAEETKEMSPREAILENCGDGAAVDCGGGGAGASGVCICAILSSISIERGEIP